MDDDRRELEEDSYFEQKEPKVRVLGESVLREPITTLEPAPPVTIEKTAKVADAIRSMQEHRIGCVLVTEAGRLVGIFTERDVLHEVCGSKLDPEATPVGELMTPDPESLPPTAEIAFALNKMSVGGFRHVPVVDEDRRPVGIISVKDIIEYIVGFFRNEVLTVPPEPGLDVAKEREGA